MGLAATDAIVTAAIATGIITDDAKVTTANYVDGSVTEAKLSFTVATQTELDAAISDTKGLASALYLDGTASNGASTPDVAAYTPATNGTLDARQALALDDWSPAVASVSMAHFGASGQYSWAVVQGTLGGFSLFHSTNGTALILANSTVPTRTDGGLMCQRCVWDGSGTPSVSFYTKPTTIMDAVDDLTDSTGWTLLNTTNVSGTVPASLHNSTATLYVGADSTGASPMIGKVVASRLLVDGVVQASPDFRRPTNARYRDPTGRVWTLQGSAHSWAAGPLVSA